MTGHEDFGIQSIPPQYDVNNSYYVYTSEGYKRAVENIDAEERGIVEAEIRTEEQLRLDLEERKRIEEIYRRNDKMILAEIQRKEYEEIQLLKDLEEYNSDEEIDPPGTNVDLLV